MITVMDKNHKEITKIYDAEFIAAMATNTGMRVVIKPRINIDVIGGIWYEVI